MSKPRSLEELLPPSVNFTLSQADRVRALEGLPAHLRRLGRIEALTVQAKLCAAQVKRGEDIVARLDTLVASVNQLIELHNRYFPIEANLPIDPATGRSLHGERPFAPMPRLDRHALLRKA